MRSRSRSTLIVAGVLAAACQVSEPPASTQAAAAEPAHAQPRDEATAPAADSPPAKELSAPAPALQDDTLGQRFLDPPWFRKDMLDGAKAVSVNRSAADDNGFFASHILFELADGTSVERCADAVIEKVGASVPGLERVIEQDRIRITGTTDRYRVIMICGESKGVMRAYVSFEWFA